MKSIVTAIVLLVVCTGELWANSYHTTFPLTENPISENGHWINGGSVGLDWTNVQTTGGMPGEAFGTQTGAMAPPYNDSTAVLTGTWGSAQIACGTAVVSNPTDSNNQEVELRLNTTITAHSITGYEFDWRTTNDSDSYFVIVRWNGPLNDFTPLQTFNGSPYGVQNGDVLCATSAGGTLSGYRIRNNITTLLGTATDNTYTNGSPGIGFDQDCGSTECDPYGGFSSFSATDTWQGVSAR